MKKVLLGTLAVLTLAACSKDEVVQQNPNDAISFTATTNKAISRAADGYCNNELPTDFQVWAEVDNKNYFAQERYVKSGDVYLISGAVRYWPESTTQEINFFAACNKGKGAQSEISITGWTSAAIATPANKIIEGYTIETTVADQKDLLYAVVAGAKRPATPGFDGKQNINFRHALSQIEFAAVNQNPKIYVEISQVQVVRVNNKGDFKFPTVSTTDNVEEHTFAGTYPLATTIGSWDNQTGDATYKTTEFAAVKLSQIGYDEGTSTYTGSQAAASSLTIDDPTSPKHEYNENTMYLLPQDVTAWDPSVKAIPAEGTGAYFLVKTKIWNVAAGDGHRAAADEIVLWGDASGKDIAVPVPTITWEPGKRYVYTFTFTTTGNAGTDPDNGNPVLVPIKLNVTVDDFVNGGVDDPVNMNK